MLPKHQVYVKRSPNCYVCIHQVSLVPPWQTHFCPHCQSSAQGQAHNRLIDAFCFRHEWLSRSVCWRVVLNSTFQPATFFPVARQEESLGNQSSLTDQKVSFFALTTGKLKGKIGSTKQLELKDGSCFCFAFQPD